MRHPGCECRKDLSSVTKMRQLEQEIDNEGQQKSQIQTGKNKIKFHVTRKP